MDSTQRHGESFKILLTGGHAATTGIAVIEEIQRRLPSADIAWIGSKSAISGSKATTLEHKIYPSMGVKYFEIKAGKLQTKFTRYTIPLILMIPIGFFQAMTLVFKIKPKVILSFGGFASFPVVFWGWLAGIPVILHEQTVAAGRALLLSARFSKKIALARAESQRYFPEGKTVVTGNPLMKEITDLKPKNTLGSEKTILIMGGSRGSEFINEEVFKITSLLKRDYRVIHITGERDFDKYKHLNSKNYAVIPFVDPRKMHKYYSEADLIIGRSGANTVAEIIYLKLPAILIPLPRTFMNEQYKNAKYAESMGLAKVLTETEVNPEVLGAAIQTMFNNWNRIVAEVPENSPDTEASEKLVNLLLEYK
jgi:UDP-N-acetylglucosamine--N-acetylmuramyl-(pentapeptide) pyrophosphoryl-undecaprenol N-acetylglucosamine transferase